MSVTSGRRPTARTILDEATGESGVSADGEEELARLAEALVRRAAPVRFTLVESAAEREAIFRLRYQVVVERGWAPPAAMPGGLECDADDERAEFVAGWDGDNLVACARLLYPAPGQLLPVERIFALTVEPAGRVVNIDRLIVARSHSDHGHRVLAGLLACCWQDAAAKEIRVAAGIDSRAMLRLYRLLGVDVAILGPARPHWNEDRYPVRFDVGEMLPGLTARWSELARPDLNGNGGRRP